MRIRSDILNNASPAREPDSLLLTKEALNVADEMGFDYRPVLQAKLIIAARSLPLPVPTTRWVRPPTAADLALLADHLVKTQGGLSCVILGDYVLQNLAEPARALAPLFEGFLRYRFPTLGAADLTAAASTLALDVVGRVRSQGKSPEAAIRDYARRLGGEWPARLERCMARNHSGDLSVLAHLMAADDSGQLRALAPAYIDGLIDAAHAFKITAPAVIMAAVALARLPPAEREIIDRWRTQVSGGFDAARDAFFGLLLSDRQMLAPHGAGERPHGLIRLENAMREIAAWRAELAEAVSKHPEKKATLQIAANERLEWAFAENRLGLERSAALVWPGEGAPSTRVAVRRYPGVSAADEAAALTHVREALSRWPAKVARMLLDGGLSLQLVPQTSIDHPNLFNDRSGQITHNGVYQPMGNILAINVDAMRTRPPLDVVKTIAHELAHVFSHRVGSYRRLIDAPIHEADNTPTNGLRVHRQGLQARYADLMLRSRRQPERHFAGLALAEQVGAVSPYGISLAVDEELSDGPIKERRDQEFLAENIAAYLCERERLQSLDPVMAAAIAKTFDLVENDEVDAALTMLLTAPAPNALADSLSERLKAESQTAAQDDLLSQVNDVSAAFTAIAGAFEGWRPANADIVEPRRQESLDLQRSARALAKAIATRREALEKSPAHEGQAAALRRAEQSLAAAWARLEKTTPAPPLPPSVA